jgi:hypothetical protein
MNDYAKKLELAYNKVAADASAAARAMGNTKLKNKKSFSGFMEHAVFEDYPKVQKAVLGLSNLDYKTVGKDELKTMLLDGQKQIKVFQDLKKSYLKDLDYALTADIPLPDDKDKYPAKLKELSAVVFRSTKLLKTELEAIAARAVSDWEQYDKQDKANRILAKGKEKTDKIADDLERKNAKEVANAKQALLTFAPKLKAAVAKGAASVQKIKADPTPKTYNDEMNYAGRDLSQNIVNIEKWRSHPVVKEFPEVKKMPDPGTISARIAAFGTGSRRTVAANATPQVILAELKDYSAVLKDVARVYEGVMTGKLASKLDR